MHKQLFKWINSIFSDDKSTYIGLSQLREKEKPQEPIQKSTKQKEVKLSDLMRGTS